MPVSSENVNFADETLTIVEYKTINQKYYVPC